MQYVLYPKEIFCALANCKCNNGNTDTDGQHFVKVLIKPIFSVKNEIEHINYKNHHDKHRWHSQRQRFKHKKW